MRKTLVLILSLVLALGVLAPAALAGRCSDNGGCDGPGYSGGSSGGAGGGGYTQRDSGVWVPNRDEYIQPRSAPVVTPAARSFGQDLARDVAKDAVKGVGYAAVAAGIANLKQQLLSNIHTITLTGLRTRYW